MSKSAELMQPLAGLEIQRVLGSSVINTDDTTTRLLTPGEGKGSGTARFWLYRSNEANALYDVFAFTNNRSRAGPDEFLRDFRGTICGDCYSGYVNIELVTNGRIAFAACNAHSRRYIFTARERHPGLSSEILALSRNLYDIEDRGSRLDPAARLLLRRRESAPLMRRIGALVDSPAAHQLLPKSKLGYEAELEKQRYYQRRNQRARQSHTKTRIRELAALGMGATGRPALDLSRFSALFRRGASSSQRDDRALSPNSTNSADDTPRMVGDYR